MSVFFFSKYVCILKSHFLIWRKPKEFLYSVWHCLVEGHDERIKFFTVAYIKAHFALSYCARASEKNNSCRYVSSGDGHAEDRGLAEAQLEESGERQDIR